MPRQGIQLVKFLGDGNDGAVWASNRDSAVKVVEKGSCPFYAQREGCRNEDLAAGWGSVGFVKIAAA
jgi:hypothetical protein